MRNYNLRGGFNLRSFYFLGSYGIITAGLPNGRLTKKSIFLLVGPFVAPVEGLK